MSELVPSWSERVRVSRIEWIVESEVLGLIIRERREARACRERVLLLSLTDFRHV